MVIGISKESSLFEISDIHPEEWDKLIKTFPDFTIYHLSCWHHVLEDCFNGHIHKFKIIKDGVTCGYWCGLTVKKFGMKIFGSPLPGTSTDYMHPLFSEEIPLDRFIIALRKWAKTNKIAHIELCGHYFNSEVLKEFGYSTNHSETYIVNISTTESNIWQNLKPAMRNKVRKAEKNGIIVAIDDSLEFSRIYYDMLKVVFQRKGLVPTYNLSRVEKVIHYLKNSDNVITLTARKDSKPLSTIILLKDKSTLYYWGGASYQEAFKYGANDLIHWYAFQMANKIGIHHYDTCGGGEYKKKFGGTYIQIPSAYLSLNYLTGAARNIIKSSIVYRQKLSNFLNLLKIKNK